MSLFGGSSGVGNATIAAGKKNQMYTGEFRERSLDTIWDARDNATQTLRQGIAGYQPYVDRGRAAGSLYDDALGINGADGNGRATSAFQTGPGYQFAMDQGLEALDRRAASRGMLNSGNTTLDTVGYAQGLANQEFGNWLTRLAGVDAQGLSATSGQAGLYGGLANVYQNAGQQAVGVEHGYTTGMISGENQIAQALEAQAAAKAQQGGNGIKSLVDLGKTIFGGVTGGPAGALAGAAGGGGGGGSIGSILGLAGRFLG